ncbi:hypothetical protein [Malaciobacter marinus]|jgi:hypothetical protein|uniref:hypothetical protein n=1 Tax=Malaciobacter marinus TaxID=505249 RepID=UPI0009A5C3F7|nr:hypothetical protein [Malaciobacter marinus]SKB73018.1 hypothetical protein SAMN06295997_13614 [Malaciobacter marinus]
MNIRLKKKEKQYAQVHKNLFFHPNLSIQTKGLGALLECYSDDFEISMASLEINTRLYRDSIRKYLKELEKYSFLFRVQIIKDCQTIWYFDSENLNPIYLEEEIKNLQSSQNIRFLTAYEFFAPGNSGTEKLATYNNTNKQSHTFSNIEALNIMYKVNKEQKKIGKI